jgi:mgtE-like transporter
MSFLLSGLSWIVAKGFGIQVIGLEYLVFISVLSGVIAGVILSALAFVLSAVSFKRGLDPDNLNAPLITAGGDLLAVGLLIGLGALLLNVPFSQGLVLPVDAAALVSTAYIMHRTTSLRRPIARQIFRQSLPVLVATVALEIVTGLTLEANLESLAAASAYLILIPPFIADAGNLASIHTSRLSSAAHLGMTRVGRRPDAVAMADIRDMASVGVPLFPAIGLIVFVMATVLGITHAGLLSMLLVSFLAGVIVIAVVLPLGYYATFVTFRLGADPDNVVIPVTNSVIDVVGVLVLVALIALVGG